MLANSKSIISFIITLKNHKFYKNFIVHINRKTLTLKNIHRKTAILYPRQNGKVEEKTNFDENDAQRLLENKVNKISFAILKS
jgi:hypothetical protein